MKQERPHKILAVDDNATNLKVLRTVFAPRGYDVVEAASGVEALAKLESEPIDIVLLDILMPGLDGHEVCRRIRANPATRFLPVVVITASAPRQRLTAIEAGADDFIQKPFDQAELLARVRSLLRIKEYHDTIEAQSHTLAAQAAELAEINRDLEGRVRQQVVELERVGRLRRFLAPQITDLIISSGEERALDNHRRQITVVFCDLRGFTAFAETSDPEDVMGVLGEYHGVLGNLIFEHEGTLERFAGDGVMVYFNDPIPCPDPAARAVQMAVQMRERVTELCRLWSRRGHQLGFGVGIAQGFATLGRIGFEGRFDYAAIGPVTNLASRLCDQATDGQILISQRVFLDVEELVDVEPIGEVWLRGFTRPVSTYSVSRIRSNGASAN
jgi:class 3 adenylate cyclase/CheY-like chemotaxis protein